MRWNITEVPEELHRKAKVKAAERGCTLRQLVLNSVEIACADPMKTYLPSEFPEKRTKRPRSARTVLPAGSVTTGMESQDAVNERKSGVIGTVVGCEIDTETNVGEGITRNFGTQEHAVSCPCYMCKIKRGELK